jgi:hypothetical protein
MEFSDKRTQDRPKGRKLVSEVVNVEEMVLESTLEDERQIAIKEMEKLIPPLRRKMQRKGLDPEDFMSYLEFGLSDARKSILDTCEERYHELSEERLSDNLLRRIINTMLAAGSYGESVTKLLEKSNGSTDIHPRREWYCTVKQYRAFVNCLELPRQQGRHVKGRGLPVIQLRHLLRAFLAPFQSIAQSLTSERTFLTMDDHQYAASSSSLGAIGLKRKKNDKKAAGFGLSLDLAGTRYLRMPLMTLVTFTGEDRAKVLGQELDNLQSASSWMSELKNVIFFMDRDYGTCLEIITQRGADFIATVKKCYSFNPTCPFAFGDTKLNQKLREWAITVPEDGPLEYRVCRVQTLFEEEVESTVYYISYRPGNGKVVLMETSLSDSLFSWTISEPRYAGVRQAQVGDGSSSDDDDEESQGSDISDPSGSDNESSASENDESSDNDDDRSDLSSDDAASGPQQNAEEREGLHMLVSATDFAALEFIFDSTDDFVMEIPQSGQVYDLVEAQRSPAWFLLRIGVATSTGARKVLDVHRDHELALELLGEDAANNVAGPIGPGTSSVADIERHREYLQATTSMLSMKTKLSSALRKIRGEHLEVASDGELDAAADALHIKPAANRTRLEKLEKIGSARLDHAEKLSTSLASSCVSGPWGMRKKKQTLAMELGTMNEDPSRDCLDSVLRSIGNHLGAGGETNKYAFVSAIKEVGLVEARGHSYVLSSVDGRFVHSEIEHPDDDEDIRACLWEHKTATTVAEVKRCDKLAAKYGAYLELELSWEDGVDAIGEALDVLGHRRSDFAQILHHAAVWKEDVLYTIATHTGRFIYIIRFSFDDEFTKRHLDCIQFAFQNHVPTTFDPLAGLEIFDGNSANVGFESLSTQFKLRRLLRDKRPVGKHDGILPHLVRTWNKSKSVVDYTTKTTRKFKLRTSRPGQCAKVILEHLFIAVAGALRLFQAHKVFDKRQSYSSASALLKAMSRDREVVDVLQRALSKWCDPLKPPLAPVPPTSTPVQVSIASAHAAIANNVLYRPHDPKYEEDIAARLNNVHSSAAGQTEAFNDPTLATFRITSTPGSTNGDHDQIKLEHKLRERCVLCCDKRDKSVENANHDNEACKSRRGTKTSTKCASCRVPLCRRLRPDVYGADLSCWAVWHGVRLLPTHPAYSVPQVLTLAEARQGASSSQKTESARKRRRRTSSHVDLHGSSRLQFDSDEEHDNDDGESAFSESGDD